MIRVQLEEAPVRLLCVDDNATERKMIDLMLAPAGIDIDFAGDGVEALEAYQVSEYDAIIMDCDLGGRSGIETTREIRQIEAGFHLGYTPILYLTDRVSADELEKAEVAGSDGVLQSPFTSEALISALDRVLTQSNRAGLDGLMRVSR
jgi:CheY-like chemotaxis protein